MTFGNTAELTTATVTGAGDLELGLGSTQAKLTSFDASGLAGGANVTLSVDAAALTFQRGAANAATGDVLNLSLAADQTTQAVTVSQFETVNLDASALASTDDNGTATVAALIGTQASTVVNVAGNKAVTLGAVTAKEVNASSLPLRWIPLLPALC